MCELLVAAQDLESGYLRGDVITIQADGHGWGNEEGLPNFVVIKVPLVPAQTFDGALEMFKRVAGASDPEFDAHDAPDRFVKLHRRRMRILLDDVSADTVTFAELRPHLRELEFVGDKVRVSDRQGI